MKHYKNTHGGNRFLIALIDYVLCLLICSPVYSIPVIVAGGPYLELVTYLSGAASFIIVILYFIVIPSIWEKQTVGRAIFKTKLLLENNKKVTLGTYIVRELIGNLVFYGLNIICIFGFIIQIVFLSKSPATTLQDKISGTKMVDIGDFEEETDIYHKKSNVTEDNKNLEEEEDPFDIFYSEDKK